MMICLAETWAAGNQTGLPSTLLGFGTAFTLGHGPGKSCKQASRRRRETGFTGCFSCWQRCTGTMAAKAPSPTKTISRSGCQRRALPIIIMAHPTSVRCRFLSLALVFGPKVGTVVKGKAHHRWLQGTGTRTTRQSQRMPSDLLTCLTAERMGSRNRPVYLRPRRCSSVSFVQRTAKSSENSSFETFPGADLPHLLSQRAFVPGFAAQKLPRTLFSGLLSRQSADSQT
jgi:hypothetical protein